MTQDIKLKAFDRTSGALLASSSVKHPSLVDKKMAYMIEELAKVSGSSYSLTEKNITFETNEVDAVA